MTGHIYLLQENGTLQSLTEQPYANEGLLQELLVDYPDLLAGDQMDEALPRRWLLVAREAGVPAREEGADHMSLDHLFLDQDAVPTLVEVKRSSDTRIRREVVGQMLDYASNAVAYWTEASLRARFEARCEAEGEEPNQVLSAFLGVESEADPDVEREADLKVNVEAFWTQVKTNLRAGRIRLLFVADEIPSELRRIVEFLNRFMDPVQVLAVEVPQYVGQGLKTLVPRLIGQTTETQVKSASSRTPGRQWDEGSFFQALQERQGEELTQVVRTLLDWIRPKVTRVWWGRGRRNGSFVPVLNHKGTDHQLFAVWTSGRIEIYFYWYLYKEPFRSEEKRRALMERPNAIEGVALQDDALAGKPSIPLSDLDPAGIKQLQEAFEWVLAEIKAA